MGLKSGTGSADLCNVEPKTTTLDSDQSWRSLVNALPGDQIAVVDPDGMLLEAPAWLELADSPWSSGDDLWGPLHDADQARVRAALTRARSDQGQATTVARLAGTTQWSLLSFLDATQGRGIDGIVVAWVPCLDEPEVTLGERPAGQGPLHGPWLADLDPPTDADPVGWIDHELGPVAQHPTSEPDDHDQDADDPVAIGLEIEDLPVPAAFLDGDGEFAVANRRWYQLLGLAVGEGANWLDCFDVDDVARLEALAVNSSEVDTTVRLPVVDGAVRWIRIRGLSRPEARGAGGIWILHDVTDNVTLVGTVADLERQIADADPPDDARDREEGSTAAVLVVSVEGLSRVRTAHGEAAADLVLTATSERLRAILRPHDHVGQLASDEFAVVCTRMRGGDGALSVANRILAELQSPFEIGSDQFSLSASIGVAVTDNPSSDPAALLSEATAARNDARRRGVTMAAAHRSG